MIFTQITTPPYPTNKEIKARFVWELKQISRRNNMAKMTEKEINVAIARAKKPCLRLKLNRIN